MELTRLQQLVSNKAANLKEAKHHDDMEGIRSLIEDALGDLKDKLGKKGSLADLFKSSGAGKLDTQKDDEGKTILRQINDSTEEYVRKMKKLMIEAESLVGMISEGKKRLTEGKDYSDSSEFTDELIDLMNNVTKIKAIVKNPRWMEWLSATDDNYGTDSVVVGRATIRTVMSLDENVKEIEKEMDKADGV